jgi:hypothetical protein
MSNVIIIFRYSYSSEIQFENFNQKLFYFSIINLTTVFKQAFFQVLSTEYCVAINKKFTEIMSSD